MRLKRQRRQSTMAFLHGEGKTLRCKADAHFFFPSLLSALSRMQRHKRVLEHVIRYAAALRDPLGLVERPVDPEVNPALAILFFRLGKRREAAWNERTRVSIVASRNPVQLVRHEREGDLVCPVEVAQGLKQRAAESGVAGRVCGEWRREVWSLQVARGRAQRRPG